MKIIYRFLVVIFAFSVVIAGCDFLDDFKQDQPSEFSIDFLEDDTFVFAERDNTISIDVRSDNGISKVEIRQNFVLISGTEVSYDGEKNVNYSFEVIPPKSAIGQTVEYAVVAFDTEGYAINKELVITVKKAPNLVKVLLPPSAPTSISYKDAVAFAVPFSSSTELAKIMIKLEDDILFEKSSGFASPDADVINFSYNNFDVLAPGEDRNFEFDFIGIAPINETMFDTTIVTYTVFVKGPRVPLPVSEAKDFQLGFQSNATVPQFIDVETGGLFFYLSAPYGLGNSDKIDFGFYRSGSNKLCLANPTESGASDFIYNNADYGFKAWATRNRTEFVKVIDPELLDESKFNSATTDELFYEAYENAPVIADTFKKMTAGDIIVFKTVSGKFGAMLIKSYIDSASGTVDFSLKIQE